MITINGTSHDLPSSLPLPQLLEEIGFGEKPVVIELNGNALSPDEFSEQTIQKGDRLEIIIIAAGG